LVSLFIFICLAGGLQGIPSCSQTTIYVHPPSYLSPATNLLSENLTPHPTENAFIVGSGDANGQLFIAPCSGAATNFTAPIAASSLFVLGVKINPYNNLLYALYGSIPPAYNTTSGQGLVRSTSFQTPLPGSLNQRHRF